MPVYVAYDRFQYVFLIKS